MYLMELDEGLPSNAPWKAYTPCDARCSAPLVQEIDILLDDASYSKSMVSLLEMLERGVASPRGFDDLKATGRHCHEAVAAEGIFEFIKGSLRMYWFYGEDRRVIVVATVQIKKGNRTPATLRTRLVALKSEYVAAHTSGKLIVLKSRV